MGDRLRIADTSFLYALFSETDELHAKAVSEAGKADALSIPSEILSETLSLVHRRQGFQAARATGDWIRAQANIEMCTPSKPIIEDTWRIFMSGAGKLSYPDSVVIAHCRALDAKPLTFDRTILAHEKKKPKA